MIWTFLAYKSTGRNDNNLLYMRYSWPLKQTSILTLLASRFVFYQQCQNAAGLKLCVVGQSGSVLGETGLLKSDEYVQSVRLDTVLTNGRNVKLKSAGVAILSTMVSVDWNEKRIRVVCLDNPCPAQPGDDGVGHRAARRRRYTLFFNKATMKTLIWCSVKVDCFA